MIKKTRCSGTWTESRYWVFIRSVLRRAWVKYPVRSHALQSSRRAYKGQDKRTKWEYRCNVCKQWYKGKDVEVDHIEECGSLKKCADLPGFVSRLFCELDNLQVLCKECHRGKNENKSK